MDSFANEYLSELASGEPYRVKDSAPKVGRLVKAGQIEPEVAVKALYDAWDGAYGLFEGDGFGTYRDKCQGIAEGLWIIGSPEAIKVAMEIMEGVIRDSKGVGPGGDPRSEKTMLSMLQSGAEYQEDWSSHVSSKSKGGCFIATAALGSPDAAQIGTLYRWRDEVLTHSASGRAFIRVYYWVSPRIAPLIERSSLARRATVRWLINPLCARLKSQVEREDLG